MTRTTAAIYLGAQQFTTRTQDVRPPAAGQVQIAVAYTGICGTDLHIFHGDMDQRVNPPGIIGHEMSGTIAALGEGVREWNIGDPITVMPLDWCAQCPACLAGHTHICHHLNFIGIDSTGAMQGRWNVAARTLIRLPPTLSLKHAALIEPTAVAVHDVRRAAVQMGETAVVIGAGPVGALIGCVARDAGADVIVLDLDPYRRGVAEQLGLTTLDAARPDIADVINDWTGGAGASIAFEVSGSAAGVTRAVGSLAVRGRLVLVGIHSQPREINLHRFFWRELTLLGARLYERRDFDDAVQLLAQGAIAADLLISRVEPLAHTAGAFHALESGAGVMKILIDCQSGSDEITQGAQK